jgi:hypothetical protein
VTAAGGSLKRQLLNVDISLRKGIAEAMELERGQPAVQAADTSNRTRLYLTSRWYRATINSAVMLIW